MDITYPEINPYLDELIDKAKKEKNSFEEYEEICMVSEYIDSVQIKAMVSKDIQLEENKELTSQDIEKAKKEEKRIKDDPRSELTRLYRDFFDDDDDKDGPLEEV